MVSDADEKMEAWQRHKAAVDGAVQSEDGLTRKLH